MEETTEKNILHYIQSHRSYFSSNKTLSVDFRLEQLHKLKDAITKSQQKIEEALWIDLHKSAQEAYLTEISIVTSEIDFHIKHLKKWAKRKRVKTPIQLIPSKSSIIYEPLGLSLIIAPWNYPFQLLINSLVGSISGGCCTMLKPSPYTPTVARVIEEMISEAFDSAYISVVQGGRQTNQLLLSQRFDIIFLTGSPALGKVVMKAAAEHLTPVVLELGGKSPCIVDQNADVDIAAKRIAWGKMINAGQTCIAPDYLFVHATVKDQLLERIEYYITKWYGENPKESPYYPRIVNSDAVDRLSKLLQHGRIVFGAEVDKANRYISPTIIDEVKPDYPIMQEEIFGPILPVMTFDTISEAIEYVNTNEKPLALYYFGKNNTARKVLTQTTSGGACVNDTLMHITNHHLPFGGVGNSGMGKYHGRDSFLAFSNQRAVVSSPTWFDLPAKYVPFPFFKWIIKII